MTLHVSNDNAAGGARVCAPTLDLRFPVRDILEEALRVFAVNPFGFLPKASFWREIGIGSSSEVRESAMRECITKGALLPIDSVWGAPRGFLPGAIAFTSGLRTPAIPGLPGSPGVDEIRINSKLRILAKVADVLVYERGDLPVSSAPLSIGMDRAFMTTFIDELVTDGFLERDGKRVLPTVKMQEALGRHDLIAKVRGEVPDEARSLFKSQHQLDKEKKKEVLQAMQGPLVDLLRRSPGLTLTEIFKAASGDSGFLPPDFTKQRLDTVLANLVKEKVLKASPKRVGTIQRVMTYSVVDAPRNA